MCATIFAYERSLCFFSLLLSLIPPRFCVVYEQGTIPFKSKCCLFLAHYMTSSFFLFCFSCVTAPSILASFFSDMGQKGRYFRNTVLGRFEMKKSQDNLLLCHDCGWGVPHRQAIYKACQSSFLFHTVGSCSDLHWRLTSLLTVPYGKEQWVRVKLEGEEAI